MLKRRLVQTLSLIALHSSWGPELKWFCNPVLSCHSCALSWFACPIGVFVHYSGYHLFPFFALGTILLFGILIGKLFCGWVCPFGFLQDLFHKIPSQKIKIPKWTSNIKYFVLFSMVLFLPFIFGEQTYYSFCRVCPAATMQVTTPDLITNNFKNISTLTIIRFSILFLIILFVIVNSRAFCKTLCPIGAILAPLNYISFWTVKFPAEMCDSCNNCDKYCITDVEPSKRITKFIPANRSLDCVVCHDCQKACPSRKREKEK